MPRKESFVGQTVREQLSVARGADYWRTLEEWSDSDEFRAALGQEYPAHAETWEDGTSRRKFLQLMGASFALAGLHGCNANQPHEDIVPYVVQPEGLTPGKSQFYATTMPSQGYGLGLLVESRMGRPIKAEGNPLHPAVPPAAGREGDFRAGATDTFAQASLLTMYDPDRSHSVAFRGQIRPFGSFLSDLRSQLARVGQGKGLRILTRRITSPTVQAQLKSLQEKYPESRVHHYEPLNDDGARDGCRLAFGQPLQPLYDLKAADIVVSLDADFLNRGPSWLRDVREFTDRRRLIAGGDEQAEVGSVNRFYSIESSPSLTGSLADHRLVQSPRQLTTFLHALAAKLGVVTDSGLAKLDNETDQKFLDVLVEDLEAKKGRSLIVAGEQLSGAAHAVVLAINEKLENLGKTVRLIEPVDTVGQKPDEATDGTSLAELAKDMQAGDVDVLMVLDSNPVYSAPGDLDFATALKEVPFRVHCGVYFDETARLCDWHIPETHFLESWGDVRAFDGTVSFIQPLIDPLYDGKSLPELLAYVLDAPVTDGLEILREHWQATHGEQGFETFWANALHDGVVPDTASSPVDVSLNSSWASAESVQSFLSGADQSGDVDGSGWELVFRPDPTIGDGEWANNGWLQELPKPFTKLTWDNAALISPADAKALGVRDGDNVEIQVGESTIVIPVFRLPHQPSKTVTLHLGYGREFPGRVGNGVGVNVNPLRSSDSPWFAAGAKLKPTGGRTLLATTQHHHLMEGRELVKKGTARELEQHPEDPHFMHFHHEAKTDATLYPEPPENEIRWGMVIDQSACLGCSACTIACQSENNIPVVGKEEVARGREMHWIRVDAYYEGDPETSTQAFHQPVPCMHCEYAPCEPVCPVHATTHSPEGINEMTYNRCIGTRYCANNCPYKVRRFNFLEYTQPVEDQPVLQLLQNPEVTVRSRGVMEKCTYCIQRIQQAKIGAEVEGRDLRDGDVVTACQAVCPTQAIVFGNLSDPDSRVSRANDSPLVYGLLEHLNTRPRTRYGAVVRNPHPKLEAAQPHDGAH